MAKEEVKVRRLTVSLLFTWLFCIFLGYLGVTSLFTVSIISGLSLIAACALICPPLTKLIREKYHFELSKGIKFLILIGLLFVYGSFAPQQQSAAPEKVLNLTYKIGDRVKVGDYAYTVHGMSKASAIGSNTSLKQAGGVFLIFDISVENIGNKTKTMWFGPDMIVIDELNREFSKTSTDITFAQMQPGLPKRGKIIFDVPVGITPRLKVSGGGILSQKTAVIKLVNY